MAERTLENAQVHLLATAYDLSRDSRLARAIVREVNAALDREEARRGVQRVRPGELYLRTSRGPLVVPIRTQEEVRRVLGGENWSSVRRDILVRVEAGYRALFPEMKEYQWERVRRGLGLDPLRGFGRSDTPSPHNMRRRHRPWGQTTPDAAPLRELDIARGRRQLQRGSPHPGHRPETLSALAQFLGSEAGVPPAVQEPMLLDLIALRARFAPRIGTLKSGQMPLCAMHVDSARSLWQSTRYQPLAPVVVTLLRDDERAVLARKVSPTYAEVVALTGRRMARVLTEAYTQNGLLSFAELQWVFLASIGTVSRVVDLYQRTEHVILPCPGSVLDMGRMLTHKDLVVRLNLQGLSTLEIAQKAYHNPRSVDAYLKAFDAVLILQLYGLPKALIASVLGKGESLVDEYLDLIERYLKDPEEMRAYLRSKGVTMPTALPGG